MYFEYEGRHVSTDNFRTFIYHKDGQKKLVKSYEEYIAYTAADGWYSNADKAKEAKAREQIALALAVSEKEEINADELITEVDEAPKFNRKRRGD